jgi:uncharacterized protein YabE (DUF348 family)
VELLNQTAKGLCEKQKQLQATINGQTKTEEANNRTVQELLEKQKQLHALCGQPQDVSTYMVETVTISKLPVIPPAINIANLGPNTVVL